MIQRVKGSSWNLSDNLGAASVKDYGAKGDGTTDDTAAIVAAMAAGSAIFFPAGTYITTGLLIPANKTLFGLGAASVIKLANGIQAPVVTLGSGSLMRELRVDGNKANTTGTLSTGIALAGAVSSTVQNVSIINTAGDGVNISGATSKSKLVNVSAIGFTKNGCTVEQGSYIEVTGCDFSSSDVLASPGDGIAIAPTVVGADKVTQVTLSENSCTNNAGRGIAILGFGSKNVKNVIVADNLLGSNLGHNFHVLLAEQVTIASTIAKAGGADGFRLEGDTVYCRISECIADGNTSFGFREVITGSTPDNNGFIYNVSRNNGNNTVTKVGAASFIV